MDNGEEDEDGGDGDGEEEPGDDAGVHVVVQWDVANAVDSCD